MEASSNTSEPSTTVNMRTEADFVAQAELARTALQQFAAIKDFEDADDLKRSFLNKLIKATVSRFRHFYIFLSAKSII